MNTYNINFQRFYFFILRQFSLYKSSVGLGSAALLGIILIPTILAALYNPYGMESLPNFYQAVMFLSGFIFTSQIFIELNDPKKSYAYLTLPVSNIEKLLGSWFISGPFYAFVFTILILLIRIISGLITKSGANVFDFFDDRYFKSLGTFLSLQSVFFLGAIWFRKNNFLKTILSVIIIFFLIGFFTLVIFGLIFQGYNMENMNLNKDQFMPILDFEFILSMLNIGVGVLLPIFLIVVSYFKLKERQV